MQNLQPLTTKELRDNMAEILERVAIGKDSFIVSKFGREKAIIIPVEEKSSNKKVDFTKHSAFGIWKDRDDLKDPAKWVSNMRKKQSKRIKT